MLLGYDSEGRLGVFQEVETEVGSSGEKRTLRKPDEVETGHGNRRPRCLIDMGIERKGTGGMNIEVLSLCGSAERPDSRGAKQTWKVLEPKPQPTTPHQHTTKQTNMHTHMSLSAHLLSASILHDQCSMCAVKSRASGDSHFHFKHDATRRR